MNGVFSAVIQKLESSGRPFFKPRLFLAYIREQGFGRQPTAPNTGVDTIKSLDRELRERGIVGLDSAETHREKAWLSVAKEASVVVTQKRCTARDVWQKGLSKELK